MMSSVVVRESISIFLDARRHRHSPHPTPRRRDVMTSSRRGVTQGGSWSPIARTPGSPSRGGQGSPIARRHGHPAHGVRGHPAGGHPDHMRHQRGWALFKHRAHPQSK
jgi:hypothetical protein